MQSSYKQKEENFYDLKYYVNLIFLGQKISVYWMSLQLTDHFPVPYSKSKDYFFIN
jgi:hypothetical protein